VQANGRRCLRRGGQFSCPVCHRFLQPGDPGSGFFPGRSRRIIKGQRGGLGFGARRQQLKLPVQPGHIVPRGLGLRRMNSVSEVQDTPAVRGMINKVSYLVKVIG